MAQIGGKGARGAGGSGWIRIADIDPQDSVNEIVDSKTWQDTAQTVLQTCRASTLEVSIKVLASGPQIAIDNQDIELDQAADEGHYEKVVNITLSGGGTLLAKVYTTDGQDGAFDSFEVSYVPPPTISAVSFTGGYPGSQTEVKANDTFQVSGTADKDVDAVVIENLEAGVYALVPIATGTSFAAAVTIADRGATPQALPAHIRVRDAVTGALSPIRKTNELGGSVDGVDVVTLNNFFFSLTFGTPTYPASQQALKNSESATVPITTDYVQAGANTIQYTSPGSELSITNPLLHEATKTVQRINGTYNVSVDNLQAVMYRASNGAQTTETGLVQIAHTTPTVDILLDDTRLRSGGNHGTSPQDHRVRIQADQQLLQAPSVDPDSGGNRGTFQGGAFTGGPTTWERDLRVDETVPDAKGAFTFENLLATGLAGRQQTSINSGASYTLGGFVARTLNFAAFTADSTETVELVDETKLASGSFSNGNAGVPQPFGTADTSDVGKEGWFAATAASGSVQMHMLHAPTVAANSGGVTLASLEEQV
jgi:hypothetical protein